MKRIDCKPRYFRCDCGDPAHVFMVDPEWLNGDEFPYLCMAIVTHPAPFIDRLKTAWKVLRGRSFDYLHEVYIHHNDVPEFIKFVMELLPTTNYTK